MSKIPVSLNPIPGFCIKSTTLSSAVLKSSAAPGPNSLESTSISVPIHRKIFINVAWDAQVPAPPEGNEDAIRRAMNGEDEHLNPDAWFVPVIVSEPRQDIDKSGKPSLVFDCIYHTSIRSRTVRDPAFKIFIQEIALQRIEAQTSLVLSRQISTPNIASKGKLHPRTVLIPSFLPTGPKKLLIEEVSPTATLDGRKSDASPKGILKPATSAPAPPTTATAPARPTWSWLKTTAGALEITIQIPSLTRALVAETTLDLEPRRLILSVPAHAPLDINLGVSDAEIAAKSVAPDAALMLKRAREFNVETASAEWHVSNGMLVVVA